MFSLTRTYVQHFMYSFSCAVDEAVASVLSIAVSASSFMLTSVFLITHVFGFLPIVVVKKQEHKSCMHRVSTNTITGGSNSRPP